MKIVSAIVLIVFVATTTFAQEARRAPAANEDYSGMYSFLREGEFVQITLEDKGRVSGFVSRFGDLPSDKDAFLDQFFKQGTLDGGKLTFTTEPLHGVWFEFRGTIGRGQTKTPVQEGYYEMRGTLVQYVTDAAKKTTARSREVVFKSFPQDVQPERSKRD